MLPQSEKTAILNANLIDLQWITDRSSGIWSVGYVEDSIKSSTLTLCLSQTTTNGQQYDPWAACLFGFMERNRVIQQCPTVCTQAFHCCAARVQSLFNIIDPT